MNYPEMNPGGRDFPDELISAYLDNELPPEARARVEEQLMDSVEHRRLFEELKALGESLSGLPAMQLDDGFAQRVLARAERASRWAASSGTAAGSMSADSAEPNGQSPASGASAALSDASSSAASMSDRSSSDASSASSPKSLDEPPVQRLSAEGESRSAAGNPWRGMFWTAAAVAAALAILLLNPWANVTQRPRDVARDDGSPTISRDRTPRDARLANSLGADADGASGDQQAKADGDGRPMAPSGGFSTAVSPETLQPETLQPETLLSETPADQPGALAPKLLAQGEARAALGAGDPAERRAAQRRGFAVDDVAGQALANAVETEGAPAVPRPGGQSPSQLRELALPGAKEFAARQGTEPAAAMPRADKGQAVKADNVATATGRHAPPAAPSLPAAPPAAGAASQLAAAQPSHGAPELAKQKAAGDGTLIVSLDVTAQALSDRLIDRVLAAQGLAVEPAADGSRRQAAPLAEAAAKHELQEKQRRLRQSSGHEAFGVPAAPGPVVGAANQEGDAVADGIAEARLSPQTDAGSAAPQFKAFDAQHRDEAHAAAAADVDLLYIVASQSQVRALLTELRRHDDQVLAMSVNHPPGLWFQHDRSGAGGRGSFRR